MLLFGAGKENLNFSRLKFKQIDFLRDSLVRAKQSLMYEFQLCNFVFLIEYPHLLLKVEYYHMPTL